MIAGVIAVTRPNEGSGAIRPARRGPKGLPGGTSFMPLRVNYAGVMPVIFAQAILMFPQQIFSIQAGQ